MYLLILKFGIKNELGFFLGVLVFNWYSLKPKFLRKIVDVAQVFSENVTRGFQLRLFIKGKRRIYRMMTKGDSSMC